MRRLLFRIVVALLASQLAAVLSAPLALCCRTAADFAGDEPCCVGMEPGDTCPMHSRASASPRPSAASADANASGSIPDCWMSARCRQSDHLLLSLTCFAGVMVDTEASSVGPRVVPLREFVEAYPIGRAAPPPAPPPRA